MIDASHQTLVVALAMVMRHEFNLDRVESQWVVDESGRHNLMDAVDGLLDGKRHLIHDRDPLFTAEFLSLQAEAGVASVKHSALQSQSERLCGTVGTDDQGILPGVDDLVRRERAVGCESTIP